MARRKIIVDSDDESEEDHTVPGVEHHDEGNNEGQPAEETTDLILPSATSTDILNEEIQDAHRRLLEQTPASHKSSGRSQSLKESVPVKEGRTSKRSHTSVEEPTSSRRSKNDSSQNSKGSHKNDDVFEFHGSSDIDVDPMVPKSRKMKAQRDGQQASGQETSTVSNNAGNEPTESKMLPPNSKGILRNQSQVSETATISTMVDGSSAVASDTPAKATPVKGLKSRVSSQPSTDIDGRMPTPIMSPYSRSSESNSFGKDSNSGETHEAAQEETVQTFSDEAPKEPSSSASVISPSKSIMVRNTEMTADTSRGVNQSAPETDSFDPSLQSAGSKMPKVVLSNEKNRELEYPAVTLSVDVQEQSKPHKDKKRKREVDDHADELGDDDPHVGVPKEQYQPRPSRSRGGQDSEDLMIPADFSKRPEAINKGKKKSKRSKTTALTELIPKEPEDENDDDEQPVAKDPKLEIPAFGHKTENSDDLDDAKTVTKDPTTNSDPELVKEPKSKKQRGRPKKGSEIKANEPEAGEEHASDQNDKIIRDTAQAEKPTKRGRPSKKSLPVVDEATEGEEISDLVNKDHTDTPQRMETALKETSGNISPTKPTVTGKSGPALTDSAQKVTPPATPAKPSPVPPKGPDKHSPISTSKQVYRVGLSKRARIEPLLRIVRK